MESTRSIRRKTIKKMIQEDLMRFEFDGIHGLIQVLVTEIQRLSQIQQTCFLPYHNHRNCRQLYVDFEPWRKSRLSFGGLLDKYCLGLGCSRAIESWV